MCISSLKTTSCKSISPDEIFPSRLKEDIEYQKLEKSLGSFRIEIEDSQATSYCDFRKKTIVLPTSAFEKKVGEVFLRSIECLVFEMTNLSQSTSFEKLIEKLDQMTPDHFVEEFEKLEHQSALRTKMILRRNFTKSDWDEMPIAYCPNRFSLHYLVQQALGHSAKIWAHYSKYTDSRRVYKGSWSSPVLEDEAPIVTSLIYFLSLKDEDPSTANEEDKLYEKTKQLILSQKVNTQNPLYMRLAERIAEIEKFAIYI